MASCPWTCWARSVDDPLRGDRVEVAGGNERVLLRAANKRWVRNESRSRFFARASTWIAPGRFSLRNPGRFSFVVRQDHSSLPRAL